MLFSETSFKVHIFDNYRWRLTMLFKLRSMWT